MDIPTEDFCYFEDMILNVRQNLFYVAELYSLSSDNEADKKMLNHIIRCSIVSRTVFHRLLVQYPQIALLVTTVLDRYSTEAPSPCAIVCAEIYSLDIPLTYFGVHMNHMEMLSLGFEATIKCISTRILVQSPFYSIGVTVGRLDELAVEYLALIGNHKLARKVSRNATRFHPLTDTERDCLHTAKKSLKCGEAKQNVCSYCRATSAGFICSVCQITVYCSTSCYGHHRKSGHKLMCKRLQQKFQELFLDSDELMELFRMRV